MTQQENGKARNRALRNTVKAITFALLALLLTVFLSGVLTPSFDNNSRANVRGIEAEPDNSIQVLSVGTSTLRRGLSPNYLYENFGIRAFNACTDSQPMIASYYLIRNALESQAGSLSVVVVDVSALINNGAMLNSLEAVERISAVMPLSPMKAELAWTISREYEEADFLEELVPIFKFHSRWNELERDDFAKLWRSDYQYMHGQPLLDSSFKSNATSGRPHTYTMDSNEGITDSIDGDRDSLEALWNDSSIRYLQKIVDLCRDNDIEVQLIRTPASAWNDKQHDSIELLADRFGLEFFDMAKADIINDIGFSFATDLYDERHPNFRGSQKISSCLGEMLAETYKLDDLRETDGYSFMNRDIERYHGIMKDAQLAMCTQLGEYVSLLDDDRYTILAAVKGESASGLDDDIRAMLADLGFKKLSALKEGESYVGVISQGARITEKVAKDGSRISESGARVDDEVLFGDTDMQKAASFDFTLTLSSTGESKSNSAAISINGKDYSENKQGINFVVYDLENNLIIDTSSFDTHVGSARTSDLVEERENPHAGDPGRP